MSTVNLYEEEIMRLQFSQQNNVPLSHVLVSKDGQEYISVDAWLRVHDNASITTFLDAMKNYTIPDKEFLVQLWFLAQTDEYSKAKEDSAFKAIKPYLSPENADLTAVSYAHKLTEYKNVLLASRERDRKRLAQLRAKKDLLEATSLPLQDIYDFEPTDMTLALALSREDLTLEEVFNTIQVDKVMPFAFVNIPTPSGDDIDIRKYKAHAASQARAARWIEKKWEPNIIYIRIYYGTLDRIDEERNEDRYSKIIYRHDTRKFYIQVPIARIEGEELYKRFQERITIQLKAAGDAQTKGSFPVANILVVPELFVYLILTDARIRPFFYVNEQQQSSAQKTRLTIHYTSVEGNKLMATFTEPAYSKVSDEFYRTITGPGGAYRKEERELDLLYTRIKVSKATNIATVKEAQELLIHALGIYKEKEEILRELFKRFNFTGLSLYAKEPKKPVISDKRGKKIIAIQVADPTLAKSGRVCQTNSQPTVITTVERIIKYGQEEQAKLDARKKEYVLIGKTKTGERMEERRQILLYNGVYWTSDIVDRPHIAIRATVSTGWRGMPWCYKPKKVDIDPDTCQIISTKSTVLSEKKGLVSVGKPLVTPKILKRGGSGYVPSQIAAFLTKWYDKNMTYLRFGASPIPVGYSVSRNALLHTVCNAIQLPAYMGTKKNPVSEADQELYIKNIRETELYKYAILAKQELYDTPLVEIEQALKNPNIFLDPRKYYRCVEEWIHKTTGVRYNIFVFTNQSQNSIEPTLVLPIYKYVHVRNYEDVHTPVILIFFHLGMECNKAEHPQCELIFGSRTKKRTKEYTRVFHSVSLATAILQAITSLSNITRITYDGDTHVVSRGSQSVPDLTTLFTPLSQHIDRAGKVRFIKVQYQNEHIAISTPLSVSMRVPVEDLSTIRADYGLVLEYLIPKQPIIYLSVHDNILEGIYFYLAEIVDPFSIQLVPTTYNPTIHRFPTTNRRLLFSTLEPSAMTKLQRLKIALPLVLSAIAQKTLENPTLTSTQILDTYTTIINGYSYGNVVDSKGIIILDSMALRERLVQYITSYIRKGKTYPPSLLAPPIETMGTDIVAMNSTYLARKWASSTEDNMRYTIHSTIDIAELRTTQPYLVYTNNSLYIIQRIGQDRLEGAIAAAYVWWRFRINIGWEGLAVLSGDWDQQGVGQLLSLPTEIYTSRQLYNNLVPSVEVILLPSIPMLGADTAIPTEQQYAALLKVY